MKSRRYLHSKLVEDIDAVQEHWAPLILVLAVAEAPEEWTGAVIEPRAQLTRGYFTTRGERMQEAFPRLAPKWPDATIRQAQDVILRITTDD